MRINDITAVAAQLAFVLMALCGMFPSVVSASESHCAFIMPFDGSTP